MGVALMRAVTLRPSGTWKTTSSARTVSPALNACAIDSSSRNISRPSDRRTVRISRSCSGSWSGVRSASMILAASRLNDTGTPVRALKTATPTGEVLIRVSRSFLARCSSRYLRALEITRAACEANIATTSSSALENSSALALLARKKLPTCVPR